MTDKQHTVSMMAATLLNARTECESQRSIDSCVIAAWRIWNTVEARVKQEAWVAQHNGPVPVTEPAEVRS